MTSYMEVCDLKNEWERWTDKKIQLNTVKRRVEGLMQANEFSVEDRREKYNKLSVFVCLSVGITVEA